MSRPRDNNGNKNLLSNRLISLRKSMNLSQRDLAHELQLKGIDLDKNAITRIETNKRFVTDIELRAIAAFFNTTYEYLIDGVETFPE